VNDIIIFGSSPFINKISDFIPKLQEKYTTIGLNVFPAYYPKVDHWFFFDDLMLSTINNHYKNQIIHTRKDLQGHLDLFKITNYECFYPNSFIYEEKKDSLLFINYTITCAIHWCIRNGFKNIYLAGVDMDSENWFHFYQTDYVHHTPLKHQKQTMKWIYDLQEYANIYQLNPENTLKLPKKDIKELL
jgi:hypothetical protein